jgi:hypothetical protein
MQLEYGGRRSIKRLLLLCERDDVVDDDIYEQV